MTYDFERMTIGKQATTDLNRVFGYLTMKGFHPLAFGAYVAAAFLGRSERPYTIDLLVDAGGGLPETPYNWSSIRMDGPHRVHTNGVVLKAYERCTVPNLKGYCVRLYRVTPGISAEELAALQELSAEQVVYGPASEGRPVCTPMFKDTIDQGLIKVARPRRLGPDQQRLLLTRGQRLCTLLGLKDTRDALALTKAQG